ncbi:MAG: potassium channel protein [Planctomycetota bacterium]
MTEPNPHADPSDADRRAAARCILLLLGVVAVGTLGFDLLQPEWTWWECLYFTLITVTTVGYGDPGLTPWGQAFAAVLMVSGFGVFTYALTTLVTHASDTEAARRRTMKRKVSQCRDHIVICGYGRVGRPICQQITRGGLECVVIDSNECNAARAGDDGRLFVHGQASDDDVLKRAGVEHARGVVCAVDSDAENMFIAVSARELNPQCTIISRAESETSAHKLRRAGASLVVSPHQMAGETVATALLSPRLTKFMAAAEDLHHGFHLGEAEVLPGAELAGMTIQEFGCRAANLVFVAIERASGEMVIRPRGFEVFQEGDVVIYAGSSADADFLRGAATSCTMAIAKPTSGPVAETVAAE